MIVLVFVFHFIGIILSDDSYINYEYMVPCDGEYAPNNCGYPNVTLDLIKTVEDLERCGPAVLPNEIRNFYWGGAGRKTTYRRNINFYKDVYIIPRLLHDVSNNHLSTTVLGSKINFPIGLSPVAAQALAHPDGESGTAKAVATLGNVMILSVAAQTSLEDVAKEAFSINKDAVLWMQTYIFVDRKEVLSVVKRAEKAGFKAIVVTIDSPINAKTSCTGRGILDDTESKNLFNNTFKPSKIDASLTPKDLAWLVQSTKLPVVAKGVLTASDALKVARTGVSGILVSNHGGRQLDLVTPTIKALPKIINALRPNFPNVEVYMDSGVRNGWEIFKALSLGARAVFVGRPIVWGLAIGGENGVKKMLSILRNEFNETMLIAGYANPEEIYQESCPTCSEGVTSTTVVSTNPTTASTTRIRTTTTRGPFPPIIGR